MVSVTGQVNSLPMSPYLNRIKPWVSVICTSFNQRPYLEQALQSVIGQDYPNVELIVIDNGSTDGSAECISEFIQHYPSIQFIQNPLNVGLNRAFNQGLALAGGRYVIDLSADDVLLPSRISKQVALFEELAGPYAVVFSNATYIDPAGRDLGTHYAIDANGRSLATIPSGHVFRPILESYFICTPTMMMRRDVLNELGGYDETLAYEDFDFWVRSASLYQYAYLDDVLTLKRQCPGSMSAQVVLPDNTLLQSTLTICHKAYERCSTPDEYGALARRIRTFIRKAFYAEQFNLALKFGELLRHIEQPGFYSSLILKLSRFHLPVNKIYQQYLKFYPVGQSAKLL